MTTRSITLLVTASFRFVPASFCQANAVSAAEAGQEPHATVEAGKAVYEQHCVACHGETGAGDGPTAATLKDHWGLPLPRRDFNTGSFRGGSRGSDLYWRIATGLPGTPMPPLGEGTITTEERWSLLLYIQSLRRKDIEINDILAPEDGIIRAVKASQQLPLDPTDPARERLDPTRVPLNPLWPEPDPIPAVAVRAMHDGQQVALLLQWRDANARGFSTLTTQPASSQNVRGKGIWRDGHWNVVCARQLKSNEADDVKLSLGKPAPVAFAVWDGEHRDRNGKKLVSNWYQLLLEP